MTATNEMISNSDIKYNCLIDSTPDVIGELDLDGTISFISPQVYDMLGYHPDEMIGINIIKLTHPDDVLGITKVMKKAIKSKKVMVPKLRLKHKQGNYILVFLIGKLIKLNDKAKLIGVIRDITKFYETEKKLKESQNIFEQLNEVFLKFKEDPIFNLQLLINTAGSLLNADCALLNIFKRVNGKEVLESLVIYNEPPNFIRESDPKGHICTDIIKDNPDDVVILRNLDKTDYIKTDENVRKYDLKQYASYVVKFNNKPTATFCVVYTENREMSENEINILRILSKSASTELARWNSRNELQKSEEKYRRLIDNLTDIIIELDLKGIITYVSPQCYNIMGYQPAELIGKKFMGFIHPDDEMFIVETMKKAIKVNDLMTVPSYRLIHKNGDYVYVTANGRYVNFGGNNRFIAAIRDDRKCKEAELKLTESEQKYKDLIESAQEGIWVIDKEGYTTYMNPRMTEMLGYDPGEMIGMHLFDFMDDQGIKTSKTLLKRREQGIKEQHDIKYLRKNGTRIYATLKTSPLTNESGGYDGVIAFISDITERKEREEELNNFFNLSLHILLIAGLDGTILRTNPGSKEILGHDENELLGSSIVNLIHPDDLEATMHEIKKLTNGGVSKHFENRIKRIDGSYRSIAWSAVPNLDKKIFYAIGYDVTEQKRVESEIIGSERKLKDLIEAVPIGITISNPKGELFEANSYSMKMFGFDSKEEFLKTPAINLFADPADRLQYIQLLNNGPVKEFETKFKHKNGSLFWGSLTSIAKAVCSDVIIFNTIQDISQRKIDEEIINDLAKVPAENPNPVLRVSKEFVLYTNQAGINLFQVKAGNRIPLALENYVRIAFNENKNLNSEIQLNSHIYSIFFAPIEGTEYVNVYGMDITERTIAVQKLKESQKNYKLLNEELEMILDNIPGLVFYKDDKNNLIRVNKYFADAHKTTKDKLAGKNCFDIYPKDEAQKYLDDDLEVIKSKKPKLNFIEPWDVVEGRRWVNSSKVPLFDQNNKSIGIIGFSTDVTVQVKAEQNLRESEEKYRILVETAEMGLIEFDVVENRVSYINPKLLEILGYTKDELFNEKIFMEIVHHEDIENLLRSSEDIHIEFRIYTKDQKLRWLSGIRSNQYDREGKNVSARLWLEDTTERNKLEELKSNLLTRFSHEFKTPLISISGFADFLLTENKNQLDEKTLSFLKRIKDGSSRLKSLINSFVESSQLDKAIVQVELRRENLYDLINEALNELEGLIYMREHEIDLNVDEQLITRLDKEKIYTVITNLLINAINYTPLGGKITIHSKIDKKSIIISIKDTGIGLDKSERIRLFKPFGKIERYGKGWDIVIRGMGMGLYISKEIIELHDGKIWAESEGRNRGSTFYISIPFKK